MRRFIYKVVARLFSVVDVCVNGGGKTRFVFWGNRVEYSTFRTKGVPIINTRNTGTIIIGKDFAMNNGLYGNAIGYNVPCIFFVDNGCKIQIGENVGISQTCLIAHSNIIIGNNVKIGGGTRIYTSDFHALDYLKRRSQINDIMERKTKPVTIEDDVFIGASCIILKGVNIGARSIIGAGSVVSKSIPKDEVWGGNPARFIRKCK